MTTGKDITKKGSSTKQNRSLGYRYHAWLAIQFKVIDFGKSAGEDATLSPCTALTLELERNGPSGQCDRKTIMSVGGLPPHPLS